MMEAESSSSSSTNSTLPTEIVFEILSWADVKTLSRSRCVSKPLSALISHPNFRRVHHRRNKEQLLLLTTNQCAAEECYDLHVHSLDWNRGTLTKIASFGTELEDPHAVSSCTRFVCMCDRYGGSAYICDPFARELTAISSRSQFLVAFGYVPSTDEHKAFRIFEHDSNESMMVDSDSSYMDTDDAHPYSWVSHGTKASVITVGKDPDWRPVGDPPFPVQAGNHTLSVALVNGAVHLAYWEEDLREEYGIARFDLEREEWSVLPLPQLVSEKSSEYTCPDIVLREFERSLCLIDYDYREDQNWKMIDIWSLGDCNDNNEWVKLYRIDLSSFSRPSTYLDAVPLVKTDDGRLLLQMTDSSTIYPWREDRLLFYDPKNGSFEDLNIKEKLSVASEDYLNFSATIYSPGLTFPYP